MPITRSNPSAASPATTPQPASVTCTTVGTEYSIPIPAGTRKYIVENDEMDSSNIVQIYFAPGAANVFKIKGDQYYNEDNLNLAAGTIYFKCSVANRKINVIFWT